MKSVPNTTETLEEKIKLTWQQYPLCTAMFVYKTCLTQNAFWRRICVRIHQTLKKAYLKCRRAQTGYICKENQCKGNVNQQNSLIIYQTSSCMQMMEGGS